MEADFLIWPGLQITYFHCDEANFEKNFCAPLERKYLLQHVPAQLRPGKIFATDENDHRRNAYFA